MFVLTCPSCGHTVRTKFGRAGANATCPSCRTVYALDADTLAKETESGELVPVAQERSDAVPPVLGRRGKRAIRALRSRAAPIVRAARSRWRGVRNRWGRGGQRMLIGALVLVMLAGIALLANILLTRQPVRQGSPAPTVVAGQPAQGDSASEQEMGPDGTDDEPADTDTSDGANRTVSPADPGANPEPLSPQVESDLPELRLGPSVIREAYWRRLPDPIVPIRPREQPNVLLWAPRLERRDGGGGAAMFHGVFLADSPEVYRSGFLHVQLLDESGLAYVELKQIVPIICPRLGVQLRLPVPDEYLDRYRGVVAEFTPLPNEAVEGGAPLETVESAQRMLARGPHSGTMRLALLNPHPYPVSDPEVVIEVLTPEGWPIGQWRGRLRGTIEPGAVFAFQATAPLAEDQTPGRVVIRGYGRRSGDVPEADPAPAQSGGLQADPTPDVSL